MRDYILESEALYFSEALDQVIRYKRCGEPNLEIYWRLMGSGVDEDTAIDAIETATYLWEELKNA